MSIRLLLAVLIAVVLAPGCGSGDVRFQEYRTSLVQSYQGSPVRSNATCFEETIRTAGAAAYNLFYQRIEYDSGDAFVSCAVIDSNQAEGSNSYFANASGVTDGSCSARLIVSGQTVGTWAYAHSGATTSATVTSSDPALSGWSPALTSCATQN